jgi:mannose-P-dolichol utilization defect 1
MWIGNSTEESINSSATDKKTPAHFTLLFFRDDCYEEFWKFNFFYKDWIGITISKGLGYGIILGSWLVKLPQVFNILKAQSARGILPSMFYMEWFMHIINGWYNIHIQAPFSVYGENFALLVQNIILIGLVWYYGNTTNNTMKLFISTAIAGSLGYLFLDVMVPIALWAFLMNIQILMVAYSRIPQIIENWKTKATGELSFIMFLLNFWGNTARLYTFMKEKDDVLNMFTSGLSAILNITIAIQVIVYWENTKRYANVEDKDDLENQPKSPGPEIIELEETRASKRIVGAKNGKKIE